MKKKIITIISKRRAIFLNFFMEEFKSSIFFICA